MSVCEIQYGTLDLDYMEHWADQLKVNDLWSKLTTKADVEKP